jgi:hypothetical protein
MHTFFAGLSQSFGAPQAKHLDWSIIEVSGVLYIGIHDDLHIGTRHIDHSRLLFTLCMRGRHVLAIRWCANPTPAGVHCGYVAVNVWVTCWGLGYLGTGLSTGGVQLCCVRTEASSGAEPSASVMYTDSDDRHASPITMSHSPLFAVKRITACIFAVLPAWAKTELRGSFLELASKQQGRNPKLESLNSELGGQETYIRSRVC